MSDIDVLKDFQEDDMYKLFLTDKFDVKVVTSAAVQLVAVSEHLAKLSSGIALLDKEIHDQVVHHYKNLLSQATEIETLEIILQNVYTKIQSVLMSAERLSKNVSKPYDEVSEKTAILAKLQITCDILRRILRIMSLCHRLEKLIASNTGDLIKAAQCINELDYLIEGVDLNGIFIIESDLLLMKRAKEDVQTQADVLLFKGLESRNDFDVSTALEVFHNLQSLKLMLNQVVKKIEAEIFQRTKEALDIQHLTFNARNGNQKVQGPGRAAIPLTGNNASFRANLWANMERLLKSIVASFSQIIHLYNVIRRKKDAIHQVYFFDELNATELQSIVKNLWNAVIKILTSEFSLAAKESSFVKQEFEVEFPKLLRTMKELYNELKLQGVFFILNSNSNLNQETSLTSSTIEIEDDANGNQNPLDALRITLSPFENAYLSRCLLRLTDSVNVAYTGEGRTAPTASDIEGIINVIKSELSAACIDPVLLKNVSKNISESITHVIDKCQYLVCVDESAAQVIDIPNSHQILNAQVVHLLHILYSQLDEILENDKFTSESRSIIQTSLQSVTSLMRIAVDPLLLAVSSAIEDIMVTMHREDFSIQTTESNSKTVDAQCSLYMKELQHFIIRAQNDYFSLYPDCPVVIKGIQNLASHTIELFVRHASLVRPLGDGGKMRLAADCAQMEMAITPFCQRVGELGKPYRLLRSFRPLLFQTPNHIVQSPAIGDVVPYSVVLHLLFARAPVELQSPHTVAGWSIEEYSQWLENHPSEAERLVLIKGTLEKYVISVRQKRGKEYCAIYPLILDLLQKGMKEVK